MAFNNVGGSNYDRFKAHSSYRDGSFGNRYMKKRDKKQGDSSSAFDEDDDNSEKYDEEGFSLETMLGEDFDENDENTDYIPEQPTDDSEPPENFFEKGL